MHSRYKVSSGEPDVRVKELASFRQHLQLMMEDIRAYQAADHQSYDRDYLNEMLSQSNEADMFAELDALSAAYQHADPEVVIDCERLTDVMSMFCDFFMVVN